MNAFWTQRYSQADQTFSCPWCDRTLKSKMSQSAKNPNRVFVSCNRDFGGCGLFSFVDDVPNDQFKPAANGGAKRARPAASQGTNIVGPVANQPQAHELRLAELATELAGVKNELAAVKTGLEHVLEYLKQ